MNDSVDTLTSRLAGLPDRPTYVDFRAARLGFHGTAEPIKGELLPGAHDDVFWMAEAPAVAQAYIPLAALSVYLARPLDYEMSERIRPTPHGIWADIMRQMGHWPREVELDAHGSPVSWTVDAGHPTYRDALDFLEGLGYDFKQGPVQAACRSVDGRTVLLPADARTPGQVFVTVLDGLEIADMRSQLESDLTDPGHRHADLFRHMAATGYDGIMIDDFAQCGRDHVNVGHVSIGIFASALKSRTFLSYPATHCHLEEWRAPATAEFDDLRRSFARYTQAACV